MCDVAVMEEVRQNVVDLLCKSSLKQAKIASALLHRLQACAITCCCKTKSLLITKSSHHSGGWGVQVEGKGLHAAMI